MKPIVTLTLNPAIDAACQTDKVRPIHKIRTVAERFDPGGGGINVARVIRELGGDAIAVYAAGGITGGALNELIESIGLPHRAIPIAGATRISNVVHERSSGHEYRFVPEGPKLDQSEFDACLAEIATLDADYVVASGSVPRGLTPDCYLRLAELVARKGARLVLDTSGAALRRTLDAGIYLVKPNLRELKSIADRPLTSAREQEEAAQELVTAGKASIVTLSLGADGALLATETGCMRLKGPDVAPKSAVGAGDSFVAAMTLGLAQGRPPEHAFAFAVAAGTATLLTMGTELCRRDDVERIYHQISPTGDPSALPDQPGDHGRDGWNFHQIVELGLGAVLFDLDGVLTRTADLHADAWRRLFDAFLAERAQGDSFVAFRMPQDYLDYIDGKPRYEGVRSFLRSRDIDLPDGAPSHDPDRMTICGLGNGKNRLFMELLEERGVEVFEGALAFVQALRTEEIKTACVTSSKNGRPVLERAGLTELFDVIYDGNDLARDGLSGKPRPDAYVKAAELVGIAPDRAAVVEDAIAGVAAGHAGGFRLVIGVDRGAGADALRRAGADIVISDLAKLAPTQS